MKTSRREFLAGLAGASVVASFGGPAPGVLLHAAEEVADHERLLVVVQLSGGNDGLNTVIPFREEAYYENRPTLAVPRDDVIRIDAGTGLNPVMTGFAELLEAGQLAIVQGVGYPQPNRSHFESMDIWHTCRRKDEPRESGWLGRYLEAAGAQNSTDVPAMHLGQEKQPLALASRDVRVPSVRSLERFRLELGSNQRLEEAVRAAVRDERESQDELLAFVQSTTSSALDASERIAAASGGYQSQVEYPATGLGQKLRTVAQLIDAGLGTRIYYVAIDGFDTHSRQKAAHESLLRQVSDAMAVFLRDVAAHGHGERVLAMCFSEFGRRVKENASEGTDHGAAAPVFLLGTPVVSGLIGQHPRLDDLDGGDLKHHTDFRSVYATLLQRWFGVDSEPVLGESYEPVDAIRT
ncbi:hypothetical protein Mal4_18480 [Maioricimonas rarisocia]|uniref:DUF1501 domain-containing protein n=1 Tax=Maioricimonas rarisocia TaxID=2528026 RepID=A0A517Z503_9PLAN|nr:DUF1501 domain-containing protein [Maioricimonas rarisocia]QDU37534.1 hypothetical protein Mal4_18480 [Maioricimonas rarisocia]